MKKKTASACDNWQTPKYLYDKLDSEFHFDFDPCPYSEGEPLFDGLACEWKQKNFINPPYSRGLKEAFVVKAIHEARKGKVCVLLLPVSTSTKLFHDWIVPHAKEIRFIKGRISFTGRSLVGKLHTTTPGVNDSMIVVIGPLSSAEHQRFKGPILKLYEVIKK